MTRPWSSVPIAECGEELVRLKPFFYCLEPHPYLSLGAPYGEFEDPWRLRKDVFRRLVDAQNQLKAENPDLCLAIFDAWRPIPVQAYMVDYAISEQCNKRGFDRNDQRNQIALIAVEESVKEFWAIPSTDGSNPPPHSTGAAVDLTIADFNRVALDMGGRIDEIGSISFPNYYLMTSEDDPNANVWHRRRAFLANVMLNAGFIQHPNEWWHFSYGDQLWAWKSNSSAAIYGALASSGIKDKTV